MATNTLVRLFFPSSYVPASQVSAGFIAHPVFARFLATIGEFTFYEAEAYAVGVQFWGHPLGYLTILGECLCWSHLLTQSELLGVIEDSTWTLLQITALCTGTMPVRYLLLIFVGYMIAFHLPRMCKRIQKPYCLGWQGSNVVQPDMDTYTW